MIPISRKLLIHSAELITSYDADKWGNATESETVTLKYIRIEPSHAVVKTVTEETLQLSATLFFDAHSSMPKGTVLALCGDISDGRRIKNQQVKFCGRLYTVKTIEPYYDNKGLHHFEVGLV